jgi:hypothetical protein
MYCLFCVVLCIVCMYKCTVLLPPGVNSIAVKNGYVVLFLFNNVIYVFLLYDCMFMYDYPD